MEERPLSDPATHPDLSPEARRREALRWRSGLQARLERHVGPGSRFVGVLKRVWTGTYYDGYIHAGNLAYMSLLALFPFFIAAAAILAAIGEPEQREASINAFLFAVPKVVADVIEPVARDAVAARSGWLLWVGGLFGIWTAGSLLETIRDILRRAYGTPATEAFWRQRLLSTGVIFAAVVLLLLAFFAQVALTAAEQAMSAWFPWLDDVLARVSVSTRAVTTVMLYASIWLLFVSLTPAAYRRRRYPKWPGALLVTVWWTATTLMLPPVLRAFFTYDLTYGSLAGVMIALFFFWLVGLGVVVGAELNAALAETPEEREASQGVERDDKARTSDGAAG
jgi:membrane protein